MRDAEVHPERGRKRTEVRETHAKVVLVGQSSVGKSSLALKFAKGSFNPNQQSTIGAAFLTRMVATPTHSVHLDLWDTAGQERYNSLAPMYYRGSDAIVLVYDITSLESFRRIKEWSNEVSRNLGASEVTKVLVGNKSDLEREREVGRQEAEQYAESEGMMYIEASAKTSHHVDLIFKSIASAVQVKDKPEAHGITFGSVPSSFGCC